MRAVLASAALIAAVITATAAAAQPPVQNVSPYRHGNLAAAQSLSREAFDRLTAAQQANGYDLGGHAGRAKELLREANDEMKMAAQVANWR